MNKFKYNPEPKDLEKFPTRLERPVEEVDQLKTLYLQPEEEKPKGDSLVYSLAEIGKDLSMLALPWKQREAVKTGWKITKFLSGKK